MSVADTPAVARRATRQIPLRWRRELHGVGQTPSQRHVKTLRSRTPFLHSDSVTRPSIARGRSEYYKLHFPRSRVSQKQSQFVQGFKCELVVVGWIALNFKRLHKFWARPETDQCVFSLSSQDPTAFRSLINKRTAGEGKQCCHIHEVNFNAVTQKVCKVYPRSFDAIYQQMQILRDYASDQTLLSHNLVSKWESNNLCADHSG